MKLKQGRIIVIPLPHDIKEQLCSDEINPPLALVDLCDEDLDILQKSGIRIFETGRFELHKWVHVYTKRKAKSIANKPIDDTYDFKIKTPPLGRGRTFLCLLEEG